MKKVSAFLKWWFVQKNYLTSHEEKGLRLQSKTLLSAKSLLNAQLLGLIVKKSIHGRILLIFQSDKPSIKLL